MNGKQPDESSVARWSHQCHSHHGSEKQFNAQLNGTLNDNDVLTLNHDPSAEDGDMDYPLHVQSNAISNLFY